MTFKNGQNELIMVEISDCWKGVGVNEKGNKRVWGPDGSVSYLDWGRGYRRYAFVKVCLTSYLNCVNTSIWASLGDSVVKNLPAIAGDVGSIPGWGRSAGEGNGNPPQYSCLENPMDRGAWWTTVHGVAKESDTTLRLHNNISLKLIVNNRVVDLKDTHQEW